MTFNPHLCVLRALVLTCVAEATSGYTATDVGHDNLNRVDAVVEGSNANHRFLYDSSGNRTNYSASLGFSIASLANQQIAANATLSLPIATIGTLPSVSAAWTVRSSNKQLVPRSAIHIAGAGTASPTVEITATSGEVGTTTITIVANDGSVAAATSFVLTVGTNRSPLAINDSAQHPPGSGIKIEKRKLLANDSDPDADPISMISLSATSAHGGIVRFFGPFVAYDPPAGYNGPDFFQYTISDNKGATAVGTVRIASQPIATAIPSTVIGSEFLPNGNRRVGFIGVPNLVYRIQASVDLVAWIDVGTSSADDHGLYQFEDTETSIYPTRFYRSVFP